MPSTTRRRPGRGGGVPVISLVPDPGRPPVFVLRMHENAPPPVETVAHTHDFPALVYFEHGGGELRTGNRRWPVETGDLFVVAPGDVIDPDTSGADGHPGGCGVFFTPDALGPDRPGALLSWPTHPLLFPFARGASSSGALRLRVPEPERAGWVAGVAAIESELATRRDGYRQATLAHLTLLLVTTARLARDEATRMEPADPLLAAVFAAIERRFAGQVSLRDVAAELALTPGHLTTVVRRRTGRTVQDWITDRRMAEARRLLTETDLPVNEIARRTGYPDPAYFARAFRREHARTPRQWRGGP